jgi:hypothetical protein
MVSKRVLAQESAVEIRSFWKGDSGESSRNSQDARIP